MAGRGPPKSVRLAWGRGKGVPSLGSKLSVWDLGRGSEEGTPPSRPAHTASVWRSRRPRQGPLTDPATHTHVPPTNSYPAPTHCTHGVCVRSPLTCCRPPAPLRAPLRTTARAVAAATATRMASAMRAEPELPAVPLAAAFLPGLITFQMAAPILPSLGILLVASKLSACVCFGAAYGTRAYAARAHRTSALYTHRRLHARTR